jgi:hypothetical protein
MRKEWPLSKGKVLVARYNGTSSAIIFEYNSGGQLPKMLSGEFTNFDKASEAAEEYLRKVR